MKNDKILLKLKMFECVRRDSGFWTLKAILISKKLKLKEIYDVVLKYCEKYKVDFSHFEICKVANILRVFFRREENSYLGFMLMPYAYEAVRRNLAELYCAAKLIHWQDENFAETYKALSCF